MSEQVYVAAPGYHPMRGHTPGSSQWRRFRRFRPVIRYASSCRRRRSCRSCPCARPPRWRSRSWASRRSSYRASPERRWASRRRGSCSRRRSLAAFVRAIDIESWALLIPGGFVSRVDERLRPACRGTRESGGAGRARAARCARLRRRRALRGQRVGHGHCRLALHRLREARGPGDAARRRRHRSAVAPDASRP